MIKHILLSLSVLGLLQACGGDGDPTPSAAGDKGLAPGGSVSAKFVDNENARAILLSKGEQSLGSAVPTDQADNGAMLRIGTRTLSGAHQTLDIAGDAHFALGRWVKGTLTHEKDSVTLQGKDHESYHYIVYNRLAALPREGQLQCKSVAATTPTGASDSRQKVDPPSGSAQVTFDANGAAIEGTMQVRADGQSASVSLATKIEDPGSMSVTGHMFANGQGAAVALANQGDAVPGLVVGYRAQLTGGDLYLGVARFVCSKK